MSQQSDGVSEEIAAKVRVVVMVAGQLAEQAARAREQRARDAQAQSEQQAREFGHRVAGEGAAAGAQLAPVHDRDWWDRAQPAEIAGAWQTAQTWRGADPEAARAGERIERELRDRYGIDTVDLGGDSARLSDAIRDREGTQADGETERARAAREDEEAARLMAATAGGEAEAPLVLEDVERAAVLYDSAERRELLAERLDGLGGDPDALRARLLADQAQAQPGSAAVTGNAPVGTPGSTASAVRSAGVASEPAGAANRAPVTAERAQPTDPTAALRAPTGRGTAARRSSPSAGKIAQRDLGR